MAAGPTSDLSLAPLATSPTCGRCGESRVGCGDAGRRQPGSRSVTTTPADPVGSVLRRRVERQLTAFLAAHRQADVTDPDSLLLEPVVDLVLRGGKRIRAAFCYWGWRGAGGADCDEAVTAAAALELMQGCALIHDDLMDGSDTRRGQPALHHQLAAAHAEHGWRGNSAQFGAAAALAAGDLCLVWADEMMHGSGLPSDSLLRALPVYDAMRAQTIRGQLLDITAQASGAIREDLALKVARVKTAANTTVGPLQLGGAMAGADEALLAGYTDYAIPLGVAFQLRDDLLGALGDPRRTGKPSGDDLRDGKCTVLLAEARRRASPTVTRLIDELVSKGTNEAVRELRREVTDCGAVDYVQQRIADLAAAAVAALERLPLVDDIAAGALRDLAAALSSVSPLGVADTGEQQRKG